ncbi:MAG: ribosomal L7Ae/L30e/S12e/Gadd45 family protein, partial [Candidatus Woesearchaeota archaeon]
AIIGTDRVLKGLRQNSLKKVFVASNCPQRLSKDIDYYAGLNKVEVIKLIQQNEELGTICKKPFSISVLGFVK